MNDPLESMVEIVLAKPEDFLKVKETLTRIGIANRERTSLSQTVYILHKRGKYYLAHFKELFRLDGKTSDFTEEDTARRNTIINLVISWGLCSQAQPISLSPILHGNGGLTIVPHKYKHDWQLIPKYTLGQK